MTKMRRALRALRLHRMAATVPVGLAVAAVGCSLLTSLDDLSGGASGDGGNASDGLVANAEAGDGRTGTSDAVGDADGSNSGDAASASDLYASAVLADLPLGYWRLEEISGTSANEETNRYGGTFKGTPTLGVPGVAGSRAMRVPTGSHATMTAPGADFRFPGNVPYSIEVWAKPGVIRDYAIMVSTEVPPNAEGRAGWTMVTDGQGIVHFEVWVPNDGGYLQARGIPMSPTTITMGNFHHLVAVYTGTDMIGYIDGVLGVRVAMSGAAPNLGGSLIVGCRADVSFCLDDWTIDELAIYDHVLTPARVNEHYELGK